MIHKLLGVALFATMSTAAVAETSLHETHEQVGVAGKTVVAYRPLVRVGADVHKCHPDATKAVACEARAQNARMLAARRDAKADKLAER